MIVPGGIFEGGRFCSLVLKCYDCNKIPLLNMDVLIPSILLSLRTFLEFQ